jgi:hypothetical protein
MNILRRAVALVLLSTVVVVSMSSVPHAAPTMTRVYPLAADEGVFAYARISPDGQLLAYASERKHTPGQIGVERTVTVVDLRSRNVVFRELGVDAYWSPEGRRLIFLSEKDGLARVSIRRIGGDIVREVAPVDLGGYFSWGTRNGRELILTISGNFYYLDGDRAVLPAGRVPVCDGIVERPLLSKDGRRITAFQRGTLVVRNLTDCGDVFDTGIGGAKADFSWDGRFIAFHTPKTDVTGYEIAVIDLQRRTLRTITNLSGSSFFPSWTQDGRLAFRYDGDDYRGFLMADDVLSAPERPLGQVAAHVPEHHITWTDIFPETAPPASPIAVVMVWGTWSAHSPVALMDLQRASRDFAREHAGVAVLTATDFGSRRADVVRMRSRYGITLPDIPLAPARLPLTEAQNQIPVTLLFRDGLLVDRRLGAQRYETLRAWIEQAASSRSE